MIFIASDADDYETATSYISLARADEVIAANPTSASWTSKSDDVKKIFLNQCAIIIDDMASYRDRKTSSDQLLKFPRGGSKTIPRGVEYAVCSIALKFASDTAFASAIDSQVKSEKAGEFSTTYFQDGTGGTSGIAKKDHAEARAFVSSLRMKQFKLES